MKAFLDRGLPTTRDENWRGTSVAPLGNIAFTPAERATARVLSQPAGADVSATDGAPGAAEAALLEAGLGTELPFIPLNLALSSCALRVRVPRGVALEQPIEIVHEAPAGPVMTHPRVVIELEEGAQATVRESFAGAGEGSFTNALVVVRLARGAVLDLVHQQEQPGTAWHLAAMVADVGPDATLRWHGVTLGAAVSRHDALVTLNGEGASCELSGSTLLAASQHSDHHVLVDHASPHGTSRQLFDGVYAGRSRGVFCGKVRVREGAQKASAQQDNRNLILTDEALVDTRPQLEILADDVRCTHGATIGRLDEAALFYLRSRGLSELQARRMLIEAFLRAPLERLPAAFAESIVPRIESKLLALGFA